MKPTQITELFANIRATFVSFFSILMFVALGAGIFAGVYWAAPGLHRAANTVFEAGSLHHVQITFPYGLTNDDLEALAEVEGVAEVEPTRSAYVRYDTGEATANIRVQTVTERINVLSVVEGVLPANSRELALQASAAKELGLAVGDTMALVHDAPDGSDDPDGMALLTSDTYTITALVESPEYIAYNKNTFGFSNYGSGNVTGVAWIAPSAFDDDAFQSGYTIVNVRCTGLEGLDSFSDAYNEKSAQVEARITELGRRLAPARYESLRKELSDAIADGEQQLADAQQEITDGEQKIEDGSAELANARSTLDNSVAQGQSQLSEMYQQLAAAEEQRDAATSELAEARAAVEAAQQQIEQADADIAAARAAVQSASDFGATQQQALSAAQSELDEQTALHDAGEITDEEYAAAQASYQATLEQCNANLDTAGAALSTQLAPLAASQGMDASVINHENYFLMVGGLLNLTSDPDSLNVTIDGETMTLGEARAKVAQSSAAVEAAQAQLDEQSAQLSAGWEQYYGARNRLQSQQAEGARQIAQGEAELESAAQEIEDARGLIDEKSADLDDAREQLDAITAYEWTVAGRSYNGGHAEASIFADVTDRLALSMAALFIIVGLLVSYSAVSRIVHEQITQIGTKKALGLRGNEITASFIAYAAIAVISGSIIGIIIGAFLVEQIVAQAVGVRFIFGAYPSFFGWKLAVAVTALELILILGATWLACRTILREHAVELLKGEKPPSGRTRFFEQWGLWNRLPLLTQTMVNNCLNDKRRMFSTIVGVAGCTALIVTALTLNDNVQKSFEVHYESVYDFDAIAYVDTDVDQAVADTLEIARSEGLSAAPILHRCYPVELPDGSTSSMAVVVAKDPSAFSQVYHINPVDAHSSYTPGEGVWVSNAYAVHQGIKPGDTITLVDVSGTSHEIEVTGFIEFYLSFYEMVMSDELYEQEFGETSEPNAVLIDTAGSFETVASAASAIEGATEFSPDKPIKQSDFDSFAKVSQAVVLIYLVLAIIMAIVVLLNLNVMFIEEKKRELIVLMINGFSTHDAKRYIYNDTIFLTIIGIILGLIVGAIMGNVTVGACETSTVFLFKGIDWKAIAIGTAVSAFLSFIMSAIALRRIPRLKLTDINKM